MPLFSLATVGDYITHAEVAFEALLGKELAGAIAGSHLFNLPGGVASTVFGQALSKPDPKDPLAPDLSLDALVQAVKNGEITAGSPDTFFGKDTLAIALAGDAKVHCDVCKMASLIEEGSATVSINGKMIARIDDKTGCGAHVVVADPGALVGALTAGSPGLKKLGGMLEDMLSGSKWTAKDLVAHAVAYAEKLMKQEETKLLAEAKAEAAKLVGKAEDEAHHLVDQTGLPGTGLGGKVKNALNNAVSHEGGALLGALAGAHLALPF